MAQQYSWWLADPGAPPVGRSARTWTTAKVSGGGYYLFINFIPFGYNETYFVKEARREECYVLEVRQHWVVLVVNARRALIRGRC